LSSPDSKPVIRTDTKEIIEDPHTLHHVISEELAISDTFSSQQKPKVSLRQMKTCVKSESSSTILHPFATNDSNLNTEQLQELQNSKVLPQSMLETSVSGGNSQSGILDFQNISLNENVAIKHNGNYDDDEEDDDKEDDDLDALCYFAIGKVLEINQCADGEWRWVLQMFQPHKPTNRTTLSLTSEDFLCSHMTLCHDLCLTVSSNQICLTQITLKPGSYMH